MRAIEALMERGDLSRPSTLFHLVLNKLGNPEKRIKCIHIAGTNGKGSTAVLLNGVLNAAGYKTGLFTSPHLINCNERIQISAASITDEDMEKALTRVFEAEKKTGAWLNYFSILTAAAFIHFMENNVDYAILEVGMGGRLDPTNSIPTPVLAIITPIGLDHESILGNNIKNIAAEKGGIIKPGGDVVIAPQTEEARHVLQKICAEQKAGFHYVLPPGKPADIDSCNHINYNGEIKLGLKGAYQHINAATALKAISVLNDNGVDIPEKAIAEGFEKAHWPGRFEQLSSNPIMILDGAHNPMGAIALKKSLMQMYPDKKCVFTLGIMKDKNYNEIIRILAPIAHTMIALPLAGKRALDAPTLTSIIKKYTNNAYCAKSLNDGLEAGWETAKNGYIMVAAGSLYIAKDVRMFAFLKKGES